MSHQDTSKPNFFVFFLSPFLVSKLTPNTLDEILYCKTVNCSHRSALAKLFSMRDSSILFFFYYSYFITKTCRFDGIKFKFIYA